MKIIAFIALSIISVICFWACNNDRNLNDQGDINHPSNPSNELETKYYMKDLIYSATKITNIISEHSGIQQHSLMDLQVKMGSLLSQFPTETGASFEDYNPAYIANFPHRFANFDPNEPNTDGTVCNWECPNSKYTEIDLLEGHGMYTVRFIESLVSRTKIENGHKLSVNTQNGAVNISTPVPIPLPTYKTVYRIDAIVTNTTTGNAPLVTDNPDTTDPNDKLREIEIGTKTAYEVGAE